MVKYQLLMPRKPKTNKLKNLLNKIEKDESFLFTISILRSRYGIPEGGFKNKQPSDRWVNSHFNKHFLEILSFTSYVFGYRHDMYLYLPSESDRVNLVSNFLLNNEFGDYDLLEEEYGPLGCSLVKDYSSLDLSLSPDSYIYLKISPVATQDEIGYFFESKKKEIYSLQKKVKEEKNIKTKKTVQPRKNFLRDNLIASLNKENVNVLKCRYNLETEGLRKKSEVIAHIINKEKKFSMIDAKEVNRVLSNLEKRGNERREKTEVLLRDLDNR